MLKKSTSSTQKLDRAELHQLLAQAMEKRGKPLQLTWRGSLLMQYTIEVTCPLKGGEPQWILTAEHNRKAEQLFQYSSCDVLLVYNLISATLNEFQLRQQDKTSGGLIQRTTTTKAPTITAVRSKGESRSSTVRSDNNEIVVPASEVHVQERESAPRAHKNPFFEQASAKRSATSTSAFEEGSKEGERQKNYQTEASSKPDTKAGSKFIGSSSSSASSPQSQKEPPSKNQTTSWPTAPEAQAKDQVQNPNKSTSSVESVHAPLDSFKESTKESTEPAGEKQHSKADLGQKDRVGDQTRLTSTAKSEPETSAEISKIEKQTESPLKKDVQTTSGTRRVEAFPTTLAREADFEPDIALDATMPAARESSLPPEEDIIPSSGNLAEFSMPDLLQWITSTKATGKLEITNNHITAVVYLQDGAPVDATASDAVGDEAIIEILTWKVGEFNFEPRVLRNNHTVYQTIEALLQQSQQLSKHMNYLKNAEMGPTSIILPVRNDLTHPEFVEKLSVNAPADMETLASFYLSLDGKHTVEEVARMANISRIKLIHIVYHLVVNGIVRISNELPIRKELVLHPRPIDTAAIQTVMMSLRREDTGMFIYPAFLYFLEQEFFRSYRARSALSVVAFEMRELVNIDGEIRRRPLPTNAVVDAVIRISQIKRHVDLIAHYDSFDYAMLLPNTKSPGAYTFATRIVKSLTSKPLGGIRSEQLGLAFGIASIPDDFIELSSLLGAADLAMNQARTNPTKVIAYREIKHLAE